MPDLNSSSARIFASVVADEPDAASKLFHRYLGRLCRLAQTRLGARIARRLDAEDVVMSAYRSFFINARAGRFWIQESGDLWALLAKITLRKLYRSIEHHAAEMRSVFREVQSTDTYHPHEWVISEQPAVEQAVALADEVEFVLRKLPLQHRRVVELRLQGEFMGDIAADVGLSERTVRRILAEIETQLRQQHPLTENETINMIACPVVETSIETEQVHELVHRISFTDLVLKKLIGTGGMGKVYRAVLRSTGAEVAIKFLHKNLQDSPATVRRFRSEAAIIQRFRHPGLVRVFGIGQTKAGIWFIVMNLVHGRSLADRIAEGLPSVEEAVDWTSQVAEAVHRIHEAGVVHCDLKPANVLLTGDGKVVITDFGLARTAFAAGFPENAIAGTAPWMSPEQVDPIFGAIDIRTDVYGLGALLYTLLTGEPPFAARRIPDVLAQIVSLPPTPPSQLRPGIPSHINDLCLHCLTKSSLHRPASAEEFRNQIRAHDPLHSPVNVN